MNSKSVCRSLGKDKKISAYIMSVFIIRASNIMFVHTNMLPSSVAKYLVMASLIVLLGFAIVVASKRTRFHMLAAESFVALLVVLSFARYPEHVSQILDKSAWLILANIPLFVLVREIEDLGVLMHMMTRYSTIITALMTYTFFHDSTVLSSNMVFSYTLLLPTIFHLNDYITRRRTITLIVLLVEVAMMVLRGSRGGLFCLGAFVLLRLVLRERRSLLELAFGSFSFGSLMILAAFFDDFIERLSEFLSSRGIYSRNISFLMRGMFLANNGRDDVMSLTLDKITEKPILGWGLAGDQAFIVSSPHNIFLELIAHFGVIVGAVLCAILLYFVISSMTTREPVTKALKIALVCSGVLPLLLSSSYLEWLPFWLFLSISSRKSLSLGGIHGCRSRSLLNTL